MRRIYNSKDGSTTILVVVFMIVLIIFGVTILTTSVSNIRLAEKKRAWLTDYYKMEGEVALELAELDGLIESVKEETIGDYEASRSLPLKDMYAEKVVEVLESDGYEIYDFDDEIVMYLEFSNDAYDIPKHLSMELSLGIPTSASTFLLESNYKVIAHTQWQEQFEYDDTIRFGDPFDEATFEENN